MEREGRTWEDCSTNVLVWEGKDGIIWEKMNGLERKAVPGVMFDGLYFDRDETLSNVSIHPPFENTIERLP
jgi:hypothetical protein